MNRREFVAALAGLPALARPAAAEASSIKLGKQYGLPFLPQMIMEAQSLIERHAAALGIKGLNVGWHTMGGPGALNDALLSGQIQFVNVAAPSLATLWDKTFGSPIEVRAICTVQSMPYVLVTRNPNVSTIADFTDADRIAVPTVKISGQALALQMASAKLWGFDKYDKLDSLTETMGHPDAMQSLLTGQTVNSHFAVAPFNYYELRHPSIHAVLKSYDTVGGRHTNGIQVTTKAFQRAHGDELGGELRARRQAADANMLAVLAASGDGACVGVAHLRMFVLAGKPQARQHIVGADQYHVDPFDPGDLVGLVHRLGGFKLHNHHGGSVDRRIGLRDGEGVVLQLG